jgi:hypothetical protein
VSDETLTADEVIAKLDELRDAIAPVQINGVPLGNAVGYEPGATAGNPIEVIIAPPSLTYDSNCLGPSGMSVEVFVIAAASDITIHNLIALERGVADAIDANTDAVVRSSAPGVWRRGSTDLPAYVIQVDVPL